jgi:uncharacterized paraquat-inducible protein A
VDGHKCYNIDGVTHFLFVCVVASVWPYTKQLLTLGLWFTPPTKVSVKRRGSMFDWLDLYSKWSLVDIFVTMMSVVGF